MTRRRGTRPRQAERIPNPGRVIAGGFAAAVLVGTALLSLPFATPGPERPPLIDALFTATSALCVTGLVTVDTGTYWSSFGQVVILALIQAGGLGIMALASLVIVVFTHRLGMRARSFAAAETKTLAVADLRRLVARIVVFSLVCEAVVALVLSGRFALSYGMTPGRALYEGVFHAVSAFNNAGFGLRRDSLVGYAGDPLVVLPVCAAVIVGGLGFPVVFELLRGWRRPARWSVLTRITVTVTAALLTLGTLVILLAEATNPATLGPMDGADQLMSAFFASTNARTSGFNSLDIGALRPETLLVHDALMFIGGGSAGTAGGIKVTTFGLLAYVLWAEMRGQPDVEVGRRRVPVANQRQALAVVLLGTALVVVGAFALLSLTTFTFEQVLFEATSAFGTVGLSTGITADLPTSAKAVVVVMMFAGRIGPLTLATGLALRERQRTRQLPEERTIVG